MTSYRQTPTMRRLGRKLAGPSGYAHLTAGDRVRSWYRAPWYGVVTHVQPRKGTSPLATVDVTHDRHGKPLRKPLRGRTLSAGWLERLPATREA